jgi:hypothetical protein
LSFNVLSNKVDLKDKAAMESSWRNNSKRRQTMVKSAKRKVQVCGSANFYHMVKEIERGVKLNNLFVDADCNSLIFVKGDFSNSGLC